VLLYITQLKGVLAKNERGYRLNAIKKRFWSLLILHRSVASIRRKLLKTSHTEKHEDEDLPSYILFRKFTNENYQFFRRNSTLTTPKFKGYRCEPDMALCENSLMSLREMLNIWKTYLVLPWFDLTSLAVNRNCIEQTRRQDRFKHRVRIHIDSVT